MRNPELVYDKAESSSLSCYNRFKRCLGLPEGKVVSKTFRVLGLAQKRVNWHFVPIIVPKITFYQTICK